MHWDAPGVTFDDPTSSTPTGTFPLGATEVSLTVEDGHATVRAATTVVIEDTVAPSVTITRPAKHTIYILDQPGPLPSPLGIPVVVGGVTIVANATDVCGIASVSFEAQDGTGHTAAAPPYKWFFDPPLLAPLEQVVQVTAVDAAGNQHTAQASMLHVATRPEI